MNKTLLLAVPTIAGAVFAAFDKQIQTFASAHQSGVWCAVAVVLALLAHLPSATGAQPK